MKPYHDLYHGITSGEAKAIRLGKCTLHNNRPSDPRVFDCESVILGSLVLGFRRSGLNLSLKRLKYHNGVNGLKNLKKKLREMRILTYRRHEGCHAALYCGLNSVRNEEQLMTDAGIVRHEHLEHLQRQAKKTGLDEGDQAGGAKP